MQATAILLAAGLGTRMKSALPKTLHRSPADSMLRHLLASCEPVFDRIVVVLGPDMEAVGKEAAPHACVVQRERLGTAHAALQAVEHFGTGQVAVLYADNPLIRTATLRRLLDSHAPAAGLVAAGVPAGRPGPLRPRDPGADGHVERIVEYADATDSGARGRICATPGCCARDAADMQRWLHRGARDNAKGEYYLTDVVALARAEAARVAAVEAPADELRRRQLPRRTGARPRRWCKAGCATRRWRRG